MLRFPGKREARRLLQLTAEAERRNISDIDRRTESRRWIHGADDAPIGIPQSRSARWMPLDTYPYAISRPCTGQSASSPVPSSPAR